MGGVWTLPLCALADPVPPLLPGPPPEPGHQVNGYLLVQRLASLPSTLALSTGWRESEPDEALALHTGAISRLMHVAIANETEEPVHSLQLSEPQPGEMSVRHQAPLLLAAGDEAVPFLALPDPFEEELLAQAHAYRLHRRVQRGAHGEVWRAVRSDDP